MKRLFSVAVAVLSLCLPWRVANSQDLPSSQRTEDGDQKQIVVYIRPAGSDNFMGIGVAPGVFAGMSQHTEYQEVLGAEILKSKACNGIQVSAFVEKANYILGYDSHRAIWNIYDAEGKLLKSGKAHRPKNVARDVCLAMTQKDKSVKEK